jgi:hypothetical protein
MIARISRRFHSKNYTPHPMYASDAVKVILDSGGLNA